MRGTTNEDLSHESWMEVCREVSYDTEGFEYPSEYDEDNDYDDDDYNVTMATMMRTTRIYRRQTPPHCWQNIYGVN